MRRLKAKHQRHRHLYFYDAKRKIEDADKTIVARCHAANLAGGHHVQGYEGRLPSG